MLLSLLKILIFFAIVLAIALGAVHLSENGQALRMVYDGVEYTLGPLQLFVVLVAGMVLAWAVLRLLGLLVATLRFIWGDETAINRYFARSRERKGYDALAEGMLAAASGEGRLAQDQANKAAKYLNKPHVTDVLAAQAAEIQGDTTAAGTIYRRLLGDERTRFVAVRGLMRQKLAEGDTATALQLAQKAYALKPKHREVQDTLMQLQTTEGDWKGARQVLKDKRKQGELPADLVIRRDAVLALQEASEVLAQGNSISAREAAISANRASPDLIPAAVLAARSYMAQNDARNASRVLQKTWSVRPHPAIAAAYADIVPDETPTARLRRFENLLRQNPDDEESRLLRAELLLTAEDFPGARRALGDLAKVHPTVRTLSIMAAIERGEGADDAVVRGWLARALTASRGPQWVCDKCHNVMAEWGPVCDSCGGFDTLTWREPPTNHHAVYAPTGGAEMLPLLVGKPQPGNVSEVPVVVGPTLMATEGRASPPVDTARDASREAAREVANVTPGMVPREKDYVSVRASAAQDTAMDEPEPVMTLTDPDPEPEPTPAPAPAPAAAPTPAPVPVHPDAAAGNAAHATDYSAAAADEAQAAEDRKAKQPPKAASDGWVPVRPDVEPIGDD